MIESQLIRDHAMRHIRFSITSMLVIVLFVAVGFAALRESSDLWESGIFSLALAALLISILLAVHRRESRRAFWLGFAVFGWTYLGLTLVPLIESRLMTTKGLAFLDSKVPGRSSGVYRIQLTGAGSPGNHVTFSNQGVVRLWDSGTGRLLGSWSGSTENFVRIGHSLFALLAGWFGGLLSRRLWRPSRLLEPETAGFS